jgi:polyisoprenoid-binding protein YceI
MAIPAGSYKLGPDNGTLSVRTKKGGAAAKAGHDLLIEVTTWSATLDVGDDGAPAGVSLSADARSIKVVDGTGGIKALDDDDKASIKQTIDKEVLKGAAIEFRSTAVVGSEPYTVSGELELAGRRAPASFELSIADGRVKGDATLKQTDFGIKPYSGLFGTLKVLDDVGIAVEAELPS